jgi:hypothetical protein
VSRPFRETAEAIEAARGKGILAVMARADASTTIRSSSGGAMMQIGFVYLVLLPSILTTALGGRLAEQFGPRAVAGGALILAALGAPALVLPKTAWFLAGLAGLAVRTFLARRSRPALPVTRRGPTAVPRTDSNSTRVFRSPRRQRRAGRGVRHGGMGRLRRRRRRRAHDRCRTDKTLRGSRLAVPARAAKAIGVTRRLRERSVRAEIGT